MFTVSAKLIVLPGVPLHPLALITVLQAQLQDAICGGRLSLMVIPKASLGPSVRHHDRVIDWIRCRIGANSNPVALCDREVIDGSLPVRIGCDIVGQVWISIPGIVWNNNLCCV